MGSISNQKHATSTNNYRVLASFCRKDNSAATNINMSNWIESYNPLNNTWHRISSIPGLIENHTLKGFAMVSLGDSVYIIGGRLCHKEVCHEADENIELDLEVLPSVLCYNVRENVWSKCAPLMLPRFDFASTTLDNKIYVAGGQYSLGSARGTSSAEVYDPALDQWKPLPSMSTMRYKCVGVTWQGKIHVVGGFVGGGDMIGSPGPYIMERSSAEVFDTVTAKWDFVPRMWELDVPPNQIVAINERLFSSGDCFKVWKGHIEVFDGKLNMWSEVHGSNSYNLSGSPIATSDTSEDDWPPVQRLYLTMAPIEDQLYFIVGYRMAGEVPKTSSKVHVFNTLANGDGWKSFAPLEEEGEKELCCHCCVLKQV
ncbi:F-box/kelch-repeat protein At1g16250-like [Apium graveolens]|uniref:F-box/kelch-repeat protein At1g16250-like n=1 Tax=Apium graveolens TaxID=4045 RepID=UPI003D799F89